MTDLLAIAAAAIQAALGLAGARAEVLALEGAPPRCAVARAEAPRPVLATGRAALHLFGVDPAGRPCEAWAWARVRVTAPALVAARPIPAGAPLEGAVEAAPREVLPGHAALRVVPEGARAARDLPAGAALEEPDVRVGPPPGTAVAVLLRSGALAIEQRGTAVACRHGRACALLPSGRRVEGDWHGGRIELGTP